jgi:hypothetical protein
MCFDSSATVHLVLGNGKIMNNKKVAILWAMYKVLNQAKQGLCILMSTITTAQPLKLELFALPNIERCK